MEAGKWGISAKGTATASSRASAKAPRPEPSTTPIAGRKRGARADEAGRLVEPKGEAHSSAPAMQAVMKFAKVPASSARSPSRARSPRRSGARAPMPPIWMPMELKLAKPHRA